MQVGSRAHSFFSLPSGAWQRARWAWLITQLMVCICCFPSAGQAARLPSVRGTRIHCSAAKARIQDDATKRQSRGGDRFQHDPFWTALLALDVLLTVRRNDGHHRSLGMGASVAMIAMDRCSNISTSSLR